MIIFNFSNIPSLTLFPVYICSVQSSLVFLIFFFLSVHLSVIIFHMYTKMYITSMQFSFFEGKKILMKHCYQQVTSKFHCCSKVFFLFIVFKVVYKMVGGSEKMVEIIMKLFLFLSFFCSL